MTTAEIIVAIVGPAGILALIPRAVEGYRTWASGKASREKAENRSAVARLAEAEQERDDEADYRRRIEEWGGGLVYMLIQMGVPADKIPAKPSRQKVMS